MRENGAKLDVCPVFGIILSETKNEPLTKGGILTSPCCGSANHFCHFTILDNNLSDKMN